MNPWKRCAGCGVFRWCHPETPPFNEGDVSTKDRWLPERVWIGFMCLNAVWWNVAGNRLGVAAFAAAAGCVVMVLKRPTRP